MIQCLWVTDIGEDEVRRIHQGSALKAHAQGVQLRLIAVEHDISRLGSCREMILHNSDPMEPPAPVTSTVRPSTRREICSLSGSMTSLPMRSVTSRSRISESPMSDESMSKGEGTARTQVSPAPGAEPVK